MNESRRPSLAQKSATQGPDPLIGRMINDRYRIVGVIARGGMGKVYRAEQHPLGRLVALKVLHPSYTGSNDPEFHKRFFLEASIASKLTHPNTVTIFDYGKTDDPIFYIAMELLEGRTLHRALREEAPFSADRTMHIARQMCRSLREAHGMGVIHRDLKPANVYLLNHGDEPDVVKVLDFGLVKNVEEGTGAEELTQAGLFMGSPKYMSPEQIRGDKCDARVDIYGLGVMMYEMLAGKVPFDRPNSVHILMAHIKEEVPPFNAFFPNVRVPPGLEAVVRRCMAKTPEERFSSMDDVLSALKRVSGVHQTMVAGQLRPVDLAELSRSVELPLQAGADPTLGGPTVTMTPLDSALMLTPANGQMALDRTPAAPPALPLASPLAPPSAPSAELARYGAKAPFALGVLAAVVIGGVVLVLSRGRATEPAAAVPVAVAPSEPVHSTPLAPPVQTSVLVSLRSTPPGAMVVVGDKQFGPTPTQVEWTGDEAALGREIALRFTRKGYRDFTVTRTIHGPTLEVDAPAMEPGYEPPPRTRKSPAAVAPVRP